MAREKEQLQKVTLNLVEGDFDRLAALYPKLGAGKVIRHLVRTHLEKIEQEAGTAAWPTSPNSLPVIPSILPERT